MATSLACTSSHEADDLITCAVCFEKYNHNDRIPKYLVCLHTFCSKCLGKMLLDSYTMTICCPACRAVTAPGGGLVSLRTNEHALRVLDLEERIDCISTPSAKSPAWCHSCDELAGNRCAALRHNVVPLMSGIKDQLSQNQMNKIQLNLSYALGSRMEIDSYLQSIKQSISILEKHVVQLKEDNALQKDLIEDILQDLESSIKGGNGGRKYAMNLEDEAETAYSSALALAQTFEAAKNVLISMNVETVDGKAAPCSPWLNRIKLCLMNQVDDKAINAAGLNTLSFILLLQMQQQNRLAEPTPSIRAPQTQHHCFVEVELYGRKARLLFRLAAQASSELTSTFLRGFQATQANYFHSIVVKAGISLFVVLGSPYTSRSPLALQSENAYHQRPWISQRGDVGIYCGNNSHHNGVSDLVILLAPFSERNVRRAPLVAHVVDGLDFCQYLSHLKLNERGEARVVNCGIL